MVHGCSALLYVGCLWLVRCDQRSNLGCFALRRVSIEHKKFQTQEDTHKALGGTLTVPRQLRYQWYDSNAVVHKLGQCKRFGLISPTQQEDRNSGRANRKVGTRVGTVACTKIRLTECMRHVVKPSCCSTRPLEEFRALHLESYILRLCYSPAPHTMQGHLALEFSSWFLLEITQREPCVILDFEIEYHISTLLLPNLS